MSRFVSLAIVASLAATAYADGASTEPSLQLLPPSEAPRLTSQTDTPWIRTRSEDTATALTIAGILVPAAGVANMLRPGCEAGDGCFMLGSFAMLALIPGPSMGHWYAGRSGGAGMGVRFAGFTALAVGYQFFDDAKRCARGEVVEGGCLGDERTAGIVSYAIGAWMIAGSYAYDLIESRRAVRDRNRRLRAKLVPVIGPSTSGLALGGTF
jgi:hypothetical protein